MKIISINLGNFSSTGTIMTQIANVSRNNGIEYYCAYPESYQNKPLMSGDFIIQKKLSKKVNLKLSQYTGCNGLLSFLSTNRLIKFINDIYPDIIHLHNIHDSFVNYPMLFSYIKKSKIYVVWTLHDCWSFTGRCPYFTLLKCDRWKTGCFACPYPKNTYPVSYLDTTRYQWKTKRKYFTGIDNLTIVTPSQWLAETVKQSFLKDYCVKVINNGIDLSVFKPTPSNFRTIYHCTDKYIILGVAFGWGKRKGLDVFVELSRRLDIKKYQIVLVGTDNFIDRVLPPSVISIHRTLNQQELSEIYSSADLFVNPTREENYPTVNMESLACGTPVLTFRTGGSPEIIDSITGSVVECEDIDAMECEINRICEKSKFSRVDCVEKAKQFDMNDRFREYIDLYKRIDHE